MTDDGFDKPPVTSTNDIEVGIFNLVITLVKMHEAEGDAAARERVADYLERLINGLRAQTNEEGEMIR